ncbi:MAG: DUF6094 domain-containing protein, partial [Pseudomonadota bacterium]
MARLASQIKMGFYKTPANVVEQIKTNLTINPRARLLDTCCGEGEALKSIASGTDAETCGVELDRERFDKAKEVLDNVVWADSLHELRASAKEFGLLWLNPPYDLDEGAYEQERERVEHQFLLRNWGYLQDGGALVYIIPFASLRKAAPFFYRRCTRLTVFSFPDEEFQKFHQVVVMCAKGRPKKDQIRRNIETLEFAANLSLYEVPDRLPATGIAGTNYDVPEADDTGGFYFRSARLDPQEALEQVRESPVWPRVIKHVLPPTGHAHVRPLMPLREGHLAMLLASGMMNGEVVGDDGERLIVKGS